MLTNDFINDALGITESYQMPEKLLSLILVNETRERLFLSFLEQEQDLSFDWFIDYFQQEHSDRDKLKQDYTPQCLAQLLAGLNPKGQRIGDLCCGTGSLMIKMWTENPDAFFYGEEISERVIPMLLFNLSIRNIDALIRCGDSLKREYSRSYRLTPGERFSNIEEVQECEDVASTLDCLTSNPPYSLKWDPKEDERFTGYGLAPKSKADWAFVLHGLHLLKPGGTMAYILPRGVLFRGQSEGAIRTAMMESGQLKAVIGLPDKLFLNTRIPVAVLSFEKGRKETGCFFVAAEREYKAGGKQNSLLPEHIDKIVKAVKGCETIGKYSNPVTLEEIRKNDYNLSIPRYVDTYEPEILPDLADVMGDIVKLNSEIHETEKSLWEMMQDLNGFNLEEWGALNTWATESKLTSSKTLRK